MTTESLPTTTSKFLALKAAGFTNRDIIDAYKAGQLEELFALVEETGEPKLEASDDQG